MFRPSTINESEICKLVDEHLLPPHAVLKWRPTKDEDIPTSDTNEIVVSKSFFQRGFGLPACDFLRDLLNHYKIELIHLNPNSILQIDVFVHLYEADLTANSFQTLFLLEISAKHHQTSSDGWH
jgi:hypothetical protein